MTETTSRTPTQTTSGEDDAKLPRPHEATAGCCDSGTLSTCCAPSSRSACCGAPAEQTKPEQVQAVPPASCGCR